jgi:hypothetical protein
VDFVDIFIVLAVSHLAGDFLLQTEWQATNKFGGLQRGRRESRRALFRHVFTYTLAFVPALIWISDSIGWGALWVAALIAIPHLIQDDGALLLAYIRRVKHAFAGPGDLVFILVDQSLHLIVLFGIALLVADVA